MRFFVRNIDWDTTTDDGEDAATTENGGEGPAELPEEAWVTCESEDDIADILSDEFGWLVNGFDIAESLADEPGASDSDA